jgi:hypothetical protein
MKKLLTLALAAIGVVELTRVVLILRMVDSL